MRQAAVQVDRLRDLGYDDDAVVGLPADPESRFQRASHRDFTRSLAIYLVGLSVFIPCIGVLEVLGLVHSQLSTGLILLGRSSCALLLFGAAFAVRKASRPGLVGGIDLAVHVLCGVVFGLVTALAGPWERIFHLLSLMSLALTRCLFVRGEWRQAAGAVIAAWLTAVGAVLILQLQGLVPTYDGIKFALVQLVLGGNLTVAIYGAYRLNTLRKLENRASPTGRYQIGTRIGSGANGEVYRAWDGHLQRRCAIKVVHLDARDQAHELDRFEDEVRATSRLSSPHVVTVYDYGTTKGGRLYFVMEYLEASNLHELVQREGPLQVDRALSFARQCAVALADAHAVGLYHCDIKPANLCAVGTAPYDQIKILDFGFASFRRRHLLEQSRVGGTAGYMPPERLKGGGGSIHVDIYGLGAVLYYLLTGYAAFVGKNKVDIARSQLRETPPAPSVLRPGIPEICDRLVMRCLEPDPGARFRDMSEVREVIRQVEEALD